MTILLDVNVLIAMIDTQHVWHDSAHRWFESEGRQDWATCPIVENGVVRIVSSQSYTNFLASPGEVIGVLRAVRKLGRHTFWPDAISLLDAETVDGDILASSARTTDTYLLALAVHRKGRLATFDRRMSVAAVRGGAGALLVIA